MFTDSDSAENFRSVELLTQLITAQEQKFVFLRDLVLVSTSAAVVDISFT